MPESAFLRDYLFQMAVVDSLSFDFSINTPPGSILNTFLSQLSAISFFVLPVLVFWYSCFLIVERRTIPLRRTLSHRWLVSTWLLSWERTVSATWKLQTGIRRGSSSFRFTEYHLGDSMAVSVGGMKLRRERRRECCRPAQLPTDAVWLENGPRFLRDLQASWVFCPCERCRLRGRPPGQHSSPGLLPEAGLGFCQYTGTVRTSSDVWVGNWVKNLRVEFEVKVVWTWHWSGGQRFKKQDSLKTQE